MGYACYSEIEAQLDPIFAHLAGRSSLDMPGLSARVLFVVGVVVGLRPRCAFEAFGERTTSNSL